MDSLKNLRKVLDNKGTSIRVYAGSWSNGKKQFRTRLTKKLRLLIQKCSKQLRRYFRSTTVIICSQGRKKKYKKRRRRTGGKRKEGCNCID